MTNSDLYDQELHDFICENTHVAEDSKLRDVGFYKELLEFVRQFGELVEGQDIDSPEVAARAMRMFREGALERLK